MIRLVPIVIVFMLISCGKKTAVEIPENTVSKKVEYHIFKAKDYSEPIYVNVTADLRLQIRRINYKTGETKLLWDSSFTTRNVSDFPQYLQKVTVQKFFPVYESYQKLNGSYSIKYNNNGYISQIGKGNDLVPGETSTLLEVDL